MKKHLNKAYLLGPIIIFIVLILMVNTIDKNHVDELILREKQIEDVIRRYSIACYAQEGAYPSDLEYLEDNYGLIVDEENYSYYYDSFASNILPDIIVTAKGNER